MIDDDLIAEAMQWRGRTTDWQKTADSLETNPRFSDDPRFCCRQQTDPRVGEVVLVDVEGLNH